MPAVTPGAERSPDELWKGERGKFINGLTTVAAIRGRDENNCGHNALCHVSW